MPFFNLFSRPQAPMQATPVPVMQPSFGASPDVMMRLQQGAAAQDMATQGGIGSLSSPMLQSMPQMAPQSTNPYMQLLSSQQLQQFAAPAPPGMLGPAMPSTPSMSIPSMQQFAAPALPGTLGPAMPSTPSVGIQPVSPQGQLQQQQFAPPAPPGTLGPAMPNTPSMGPSTPQGFGPSNKSFNYQSIGLQMPSSYQGPKLPSYSSTPAPSIGPSGAQGGAQGAPQSGGQGGSLF